MNIPRSSLMEGEHTPTIIQLIRSTDLTVIQFKDSHIFFIFPTVVADDEIKNVQECRGGGGGVGREEVVGVCCQRRGQGERRWWKAVVISDEIKERAVEVAAAWRWWRC